MRKQIILSLTPQEEDALMRLIRREIEYPAKVTLTLKEATSKRLRSALDAYYESVDRGERIRLSVIAKQHKVNYANLRQLKIRRDKERQQFQ